MGATSAFGPPAGVGTAAASDRARMGPGIVGILGIVGIASRGA